MGDFGDFTDFAASEPSVLPFPFFFFLSFFLSENFLLLNSFSLLAGVEQTLVMTLETLGALRRPHRRVPRRPPLNKLSHTRNLLLHCTSRSSSMINLTIL